MYRVAIVGRPNVGKSTLFNRLTRTRRSIVGNQPGITRDRVIEVAEWDDKQFELIDTGGIVPDEKSLIPEKILEQASLALEDSHLILLVVDARAGLTPLDQSLGALVRAAGKEFFVAANKVDTPALESHAMQFHALGVAKVFPIAAEHGRGIDELIEEILERAPESQEREPGQETRVAIIGRPNVGKSSLLNRFAGKQRVIVSEIPGTTRDAVDTRISLGGKNYRLVDTAGIRRKGRTEEMAEKLSVVMARKSIVRCDVALLVIDAVEGATKLDATIGGYAHEAGKSLVVVVNKWDLVERDTHTAHQKEKDFRDRMRYLDYAPMIFVSALSGQRVAKILERVDEAYAGRFTRVPTGELNQFLESKIRPHMLASGNARRTPFLYATQAGVDPPTFVLFTRSSKPLHFSTIRFVANQLRQRYGFFATPIRVLQRLRRETK